MDYSTKTQKMCLFAIFSGFVNVWVAWDQGVGGVDMQFFVAVVFERELWFSERYRNDKQVSQGTHKALKKRI